MDGIRTVESNRRRRNRPLVPTLIAVALILYGVSQPLLLLIGSGTGAVITSVRRQGGYVGQRPNDYWWVAGYDFKASDGKSYSGSTRSLGTSHGGMGVSKGQVLTVLYLEWFPYYNVLKRNAEPSLGHGLIIGVGCLVLWFSGGKRSRRGKGRGSSTRIETRGPGVADAGPQSAVMSETETLAWAERYRRHSRLYAWGFVAVLVPIVYGIIRLSSDAAHWEVLGSLGFFVLVTVTLALFSRRNTRAAWRGVVESKTLRTRVHRPFDDSLPEKVLVPLLTFRTDAGKRVVMRVSGELYDYFVEGDRVVKVGGFDWPEKEGCPEGRRVCIACGRLLLGSGPGCPACGAPIPDTDVLMK